jgi:hypothetical protein
VDCARGVEEHLICEISSFCDNNSLVLLGLCLFPVIILLHSTYPLLYYSTTLGRSRSYIGMFLVTFGRLDITVHFLVKPPEAKGENQDGGTTRAQ